MDTKKDGVENPWFEVLNDGDESWIFATKVTRPF